jgi:hypothetical protein
LSKDYIVLKDQSTGYDYMVYMDNGGLVSSIKIDRIELRALPNNTDYTVSEEFDATGMIIVSIGVDGSEREITDYTYDKYVTTGSVTHEIRCNIFGIKYTVVVPITTRTLEMALVDFDYTINDDGTYTITGWKQTLNGEPSTELLVPNSPFIIIET